MKFRLALSILFISLTFSDVFGEAFFSGGVNSVNPESSFNALRNPALMSGQKNDSVGFSYFYSYNIFAETSGKITMGAVELKMDSDYKEKLNGNLSVSYVKKFDYSSLGLGIRKVEGTDQMLISESTSETTHTSGPISNEKNENKSFGISTVLSYSKDLGRYESAGIQFEIGTSTSTSIKSKHENSPVKDYKVETTTDKLIGNLNCGYHIAADKYEFGAILKFGEYVYEKKQYSYENKITPFNKSDKKVSPYLYRNKGLEYTLGFGYNFTNRLIFNMETNIVIPYEVKKKELKDDDEGVFADKKSRSNTNLSGGAAFGFNYKYSRNFNFGLGGAAAIYNSDSIESDGTVFGVGNYSVYSFLSGIEFKTAEGVNLLFGSNLYFMKQSAKLDVGSVSLKVDTDALYFNAILGASLSY